MKTKRKFLSILLTLSLVLALAPMTAFAAGMADGTTNLTVNQSKVAFAGHEWWVIGDGTSGIYPQEGHITLLAANAGLMDSVFYGHQFRKTSDSAFENSSIYVRQTGGAAGRIYYIGKNPDGSACLDAPNEYYGSNLQQQMEKIAKGFPEKEQAVISERDFTGGTTWKDWDKNDDSLIDGIVGPAVNDQKLWSLSTIEYKKLNASVRIYAEKRDDNNFWWLRSPSSKWDMSAMAGYVYRDDAENAIFSGVNSPNAYIRPALSLNLQNVFFTSEVSMKTSATAGGNLIGIPEPTGTVKFTMKDTSMNFTVNSITKSGNNLYASFSDATIGENNYISCILKNTQTGNIAYYGKLAKVSNASGKLAVPLANVADGNYVLKIFAEEVNDGLYTDFCSEPVSINLNVTNGTGTGNDFDNIHEHCYSNDWAKDDTHHWKECVAENCPLANDNSLKNSYAEHNYNQQNTNDAYLASAATCTEPAKYYKSCVCGSKGTETFISGEAAGHNWGEPVWNWSDDGKTASVTFICKNDSTHIQSPKVTITSKVKISATCTEMGTTTYTAKVTFNGQEYSSTKDIVDISRLIHSMKKTDKVEATCTMNGKEAYYTCESCSKHFSDAKGKNEITKLEEYGIIPATEHKAGTEWKHDETSHWNECINNCGEKLNEAVHSYEWVVDKNATAIEAGSKHEECIVCGYEKAAVEIPATGTTRPANPNEPSEPSEPTAPSEPDDTSKPSDSPQTGDSSNLALPILLLFVSGIGLAGTSIYLKKRRYSK